MKKLLFIISAGIFVSSGMAQIISPVASRPGGVKDGINYINGTTIILSLLAPHKQYVHVIGDFNDWKVSPGYLMNKTPDGERYWLQIDNLEPQQEYRFQYFVDGQIRVGDPYSDKMIDDWTDPDISEETYPGLIDYPTGKTSFPVSVFQTNQLPFSWEMDDFTPPSKEKMFIYELSIRDFVDKHDYKTVRDTLDYLQQLGVNVIELMPITDFEGNLSWGYNPNYYFAPDKYFGPKDELKKLVDECHKRGIAVVIDMVLNHCWGQNPLVRLYWNGQTFEPTPESPWFNVGSNFANPLAHFGPDYNHESSYTKNWVDTVNAYWISEYKIDGFRFDFTKGFTNQYKSEADLWGDAYDASRIAILKRMADAIWEVDPKTLVILEHLSFNNQEEKELAEHGMMMWSNFNYHFAKLIKGESADIAWMNYKERTWSQPNVVAYWASHDWERVMYEALTNGRSNGFYNVKDLPTALNRLKLCAAFVFAVPGPKMIWMFDEVGYEVSKDFNGYGAPKPIRWEYLNDPDRNKVYKTIAAIIYLKQNYPVFGTQHTTFTTDAITKSLHLNGTAMNVTVIGNFDIIKQDVDPAFQHTGVWYDYFTGQEFIVNNTDKPYNLLAGEFHIFLDQPVEFPESGLVPFIVPIITGSSIPVDEGVKLYPNPGKSIYQLELNNSFSRSPDICVFDTNGKKTEAVIVKSSVHHYQLNLANLSSGIYIVEVRDRKKNTKLRLIKHE